MKILRCATLVLVRYLKTVRFILYRFIYLTKNRIQAILTCNSSFERMIPINIYVDADACPVQKEIITVANKFNLHVVLVKSVSHFSHEPLPDHVETIYVDKGADMADFKIVQLIEPSDIVITQDYGLAAICLGKDALVLHHKGFRYTNKNINRLLTIRHKSALARRAGQRTRGPRPCSNDERQKFVALLVRTIESQDT